jgi:hypothetical protein
MPDAHKTFGKPVRLLLVFVLPENDREYGNGDENSNPVHAVEDRLRMVAAKT